MTTLTPITATLQNKSNTEITISDYSDGVISFSGFTLNTPNPLVDACRTILKKVGLVGVLYPARNYPVDVYRGSEFLFKLRSVIWGTRFTEDESLPDYETIDRQSFTNQIL